MDALTEIGVLEQDPIIFLVDANRVLDSVRLAIPTATQSADAS